MQPECKTLSFPETQYKRQLPLVHRSTGKWHSLYYLFFFFLEASKDSWNKKLSNKIIENNIFKGLNVLTSHKNIHRSYNSVFWKLESLIQFCKVLNWDSASLLYIYLCKPQTASWALQSRCSPVIQPRGTVAHDVQESGRVARKTEHSRSKNGETSRSQRLNIYLTAK